MNDRKDYEHLYLDTDHNYYWVTNKEVELPYNTGEEKLEKFNKWWQDNIEFDDHTSLFYKGTAFYFTFKGKKYQKMWTWYYPDKLRQAIGIAKNLGFTNIQLNLGELD